MIRNRKQNVLCRIVENLDLAGVLLDAFGATAVIAVALEVTVASRNELAVTVAEVETVSAPVSERSR